MTSGLPTKEQIIYSQLAVIHALAEALKDNSEQTELFHDADLRRHLHMVCESVMGSFYRMQFLLKKSNENKSACC